MKIQSAGRLGNQLFIFAYALDLKAKSKARSVDIFADKFHSELNQDLIETFENLSGYGINLEVNNFLGLVLKATDKASRISLKLGKVLRRVLQIQIEGIDPLFDRAWIQRGYFQNQELSSKSLEKMSKILNLTLQKTVANSDLLQRMPFLLGEYQAIHIRRTDFFSSKIGVIDPNSQLKCLQNNLKVVICTDSSRDEVLSRIDVTNCEVITPKESTAWQTLAILSGAQHLVMANSTLSLWAGFLASNSGKKVYAPAVWHKSTNNQEKLPFSFKETYSPTFENL